MATKTNRSNDCICICGCGTPVRGRFAPGHDRRAESVITELEYGCVEARVRAWEAAHPGLTIDAEYRRLHPPAPTRVANARALVRRHATSSPQLASEELIADRRRESRRAEQKP